MCATMLPISQTTIRLTAVIVIVNNNGKWNAIVHGGSAWFGFYLWIKLIGSARRPETKQGIEGKIDRFRSGRVRVRDGVRLRYNWLPIWTRLPTWTCQFLCLLNSDRRSEPDTVLYLFTGLPLVFVTLMLIGGVCYCYLDDISGKSKCVSYLHWLFSVA